MNDKPTGIPLADLPPEMQAKLGIKPVKERKPRFTAEQERQQAIRVLNTIHVLTQPERSRVLRRALKMNDA